MDKKALRKAQLELDTNIASLAHQLLLREETLGKLQTLSVEVSSLKDSQLNRLVSLGKVLIWLLPLATFIGAVGGKQMDTRLLDRPSSRRGQHDWTYSELGSLLGLAGSVSWVNQKRKDLKDKSSYQQTFIVAQYEKDTKRFFIYDLDPTEKPDNMDKVILKRVADYVAELKGEAPKKVVSGRVDLVEEAGRRYKEALIVAPSTTNTPVTVPVDWLQEVLPERENSWDFMKSKTWYEELGVEPVHQQLVRNLTIPTRHL